MKHSLSDIDEATRTATCSICGPSNITIRNGKSNLLSNKYRCITVRSRRSKFRYRNLKSYCENCGFIPEHNIQLDLDHIDGNSKNNDTANLQTLCANCHRLKTITNADWQRNPT